MSGPSYPASWATVPLGELTSKIGSGATPKGGEKAYQDDGIPLIRSMNVHFHGFVPKGLAFISDAQAEKLNGVIVKPYDVLLNITGASIGRVTCAPETMAGARVNQHVSIIRCLEEICPDFVQKYIASPIMQAAILKENYGVTRQALTKSMVEGFNIPLPPLAEQRRIVAKLDRLSARSIAARDHLARIPKLAARAKQALLAAAFRGELTADWRASNEEKRWSAEELDDFEARRQNYLRTRRGARLKSDRGSNIGELGDLPASWFASHLAEIGTLQVGYAFKSKWYNDEGPRLLRGANIAPGCITWEDEKRLDRSHEAEFETYRLRLGDIVIAMDRPVISSGLKVAVIGPKDVGCLLVQRVARFVADKYLNRRFAWHIINSDLFIRHAVSRATGSDLPHISANDILTTPIPLPPLPEQDELVRRIDSAFTRIDRFAAEAASSTHLLDRLDEQLLAKAFRGELVRQDPSDEPAEALLARVREARALAPKPKSGRRRLPT